MELAMKIYHRDDDCICISLHLAKGKIQKNINSYHVWMAKGGKTSNLAKPWKAQQPDLFKLSTFQVILKMLKFYPYLQHPEVLLEKSTLFHRLKRLQWLTLNTNNNLNGVLAAYSATILQFQSMSSQQK